MEILREIHEGECGHHAAARSLVAKAFRHGFFWLTAKADAEKLVKTRKGCQKYAHQAHVPAERLRTIPITWPFRTAKSEFTHLLVMVDKFTKWIEAKPVTNCEGATAKRFVEDVIIRFGYPHSIITENGSNFSMGELAEFCEDKGIRPDIASVAHP